MTDLPPLAFVTAGKRGATDSFLYDIAETLAAQGLRLAGAIQSNPERAGRGPCDMELRVLPDGPLIRISQSLGPGSSGCRLDAGALEAAVAEVQARMAGADLLLINKFGKQEAAGRGMVPLISRALEDGIPVLVGLNALNAPAFAEFAGDMAQELPAERDAVLHWAAGARG